MTPERTFDVRGQLGHRFHGTYWCRIVLAVPANMRAQLEHALAGAPLPEDGFRAHHTERETMAAIDMDSAQLDAFKAWAEPKRTDAPCRLFDCRRRKGGERHPIDACAHSIDVGPEFTLTLPLADLATPMLPFAEGGAS